MADAPKTQMSATGLQSGWDVRMRHVAGSDPRFFDYGRYGLLTDNSGLAEGIQGRGGATSSPAGRWMGSGSAGLESYGGGGRSNPGGHNWATLANVSNTLGSLAGSAIGATVDWRFKKKQRAQQETLAREAQAAQAEAATRTAGARRGRANFIAIVGRDMFHGKPHEPKHGEALGMLDIPEPFSDPRTTEKNPNLGAGGVSQAAAWVIKMLDSPLTGDNPSNTPFDPDLDYRKGLPTVPKPGSAQARVTGMPDDFVPPTPAKQPTRRSTSRKKK